MHFRETRAAIAAALTGIVLATGIGAAAAPTTTTPTPTAAAFVQPAAGHTAIASTTTAQVPDGASTS